MYFDALTLAAVADELRATILHGRIQRVLLPDAWSVGLEVYSHRQRYQILASAHPQLARVHLVRGKVSRGVEQPTPLLLLLRKHVLGGCITAITQPSLERVLLVSIVKDSRTCNSPDNSPDNAPDNSRQDPDHAPSHLSCELIIEPMDRRSNIILVDADNHILESIKRVPPRMSRRVILPRHVYELPPAQDRPDPRTTTAAEIAQIVHSDESSPVRALVRGYRGVSPLVAREVVFRAGGDTPDNSERLAAELCHIYAAPWEPTLAMGEDEPQACAPYVLTHLAPVHHVQPYPSISAALENFYASHQDLTRHHQYRAEVLRQLEGGRERLQRQQQQLQRERERSRDPDILRWEGEMILAFLHTIEPGQQVLEVEGQQIALDPDESPLECAHARFRSYQKARSGIEQVRNRLQQTETQLAGIEQLVVMLELADEREQIEQLVQEAIEQGYIPAPAQKQKKRKAARLKPLRLTSSDGFDIYVGRSAAQNGEVTFRIGGGNDLWFHIRGMPGAHVLVRTAGREVPESTLNEAAGLAAFFSRARAETSADVDMARRSQVRRVPGGPPGLVTCRTERTLHVAPLPPWG